jgi:hypothetical protein
MQEPANKTEKDKNRRKKVKPVNVSTDSAKNEVTNPSPNGHDDQGDEQEVEESLKFPGPPDLDALGIATDTTDEDTLQAVGVRLSKSSVRDVIVGGTKPASRQVTREGGKMRASKAAAVRPGPETQLASKWLNSAQVKQLEKDTGESCHYWT